MTRVAAAPPAPPTARRSRRRRRSSTAAAAILLLSAPVAVVLTASPAHAECSTYPSDRDIAVTRTVYGVAQSMAVNPKVLLSAFETGWVESKMNNLSCGDRDSLGVFQQRPSQNWGTPAEVQNVVHATTRYLQDAIDNDVAHPEYTPGQLAQSVQRSATPLLYDQFEGRARDLMAEAFAPYGTIGDTWRASGGDGSPVGRPVRAEESGHLGARFQEFEHGMILWNPANNQAWMVHGRILDEYRATGSEDAWGFATQDEVGASTSPRGTTGRFQKFDNALILWSQPTDVHLLHGQIRAFFEANGFEQRFGYPTGNETPEGDGFRQTFELGSIVWHPATGATWMAGA